MHKHEQFLLFYLFIILNLLILNINCDLQNEIEEEFNIEDDVKVFTVASAPTDGYLRYLMSANFYKIPFTTLGMGEKWNGGDMSNVGGGQKINYLKKFIEPLKNKKDTIVLFTDSYDVVFTSGIAEIIKKFKKTGAKILFGAEHYCWPDKLLRDKYPKVGVHGAQFLNSGMFIGYAPFIHKLLKAINIKDSDDDQLAYSKLFVNAEQRQNLEIQLDSKSEIFQNLYGASDDVKLDIDIQTNEGTLRNIHFMTTPSVIHGNGLSKIFLNSISNYLGGAFKERNCLICEQGKIKLNENKLPIVSLAIFVERAAPFLEEFLDKVLAINYPKKNINLFVHCNVAYHDSLVEKFIKLTKADYKSIKYIYSTDNVDEETARRMAIDISKEKKNDYLFVLDNYVHLDEPNVLRDLLEYNRTFIAPVIPRTNELWSNFWGALNEHGYYARSHDYVDIVKRTTMGMWNVPYVSTGYLVKKSAFDFLKYANKEVDLDMALCEELRAKGIFMYVVNEKYYGHLIDYEDYNTKLASPDFYQLLKNPKDWEQRYIHPEYQNQLQAGFKHMQPCTDVYWFPIGTEIFCDDIVKIMENFGKWSDGTNTDERLQGGYEAVPTRDIHMNQVGLEKLWLTFLRDYVRPLQEAVFLGYYHNPPKSLMNFVVRYRPDEQPLLRPHHDSSTFTINIALNTAGVDYTGGGCRFLRYNCSVTDTKKGWMLMHPGRLTHYHEGLRTTNGTRYIMISFVDP